MRNHIEFWGEWSYSCRSGTVLPLFDQFLKNPSKIRTERIYGFCNYRFFETKKFSHKLTALVDKSSLIGSIRAGWVAKISKQV